MLIKPFESLKDIDVTPRKLRSVGKRRIAVSPKGTVRIEEINIDPRNKTIIKSCKFGRMINSNYEFSKRINVTNEVVVVNDLLSGEVIDYATKAPIPNFSDSKTYQLINKNLYVIADKSYYLIQPEDRIYQSKHVDPLFIHEECFDPQTISLGISGIEDSMQLSYIECVGLLDSFFTQWGYSFPFDSTVIIDTKHKEFTPKFTYAKGLLDEQTALGLYATYAKEISKLVDILCDSKDIQNRNFRIKAYTNAFSCIISISDLDHKEISFDLNSSCYDHYRTLVNNKLACRDYDLTEQAGVIVLNKNGDISSDMLETLTFLGEHDVF